MNVDIYVGGVKETVTTEITKKVTRYVIEFIDNNNTSEYIKFQIEKDGVLLMDYDKTFNASNTLTSSILGASASITGINLYNNMVEFNSAPNLEYSIEDNGFGFKTINIDVTSEVSETIDTPSYDLTTLGISEIYHYYYGDTTEEITQTFDNYEKLNLFEDENIYIIQKLTDIEKLSNVFSDGTLSFTIPADKLNNRRLRHYYNIFLTNAYNANVRIPAYIEVDTLPYKFGELQIEDVTEGFFEPTSYKVTFYDLSIQLSSLIGKDLLSELDYDNGVKTRNILSDYNYEYNSANFIASLYDPSFKNSNLITPLINYSEKDWNYGGGNSNNVADISTNDGAILDTELRPAIRATVLMDAIQAKYGITFSKGLLKKATVKDLFLWLNGRKENSLSQKVEANITETFVGTNNGYFTQVGNVLKIQRRKFATYIVGIFNRYYTGVQYDVVPPNPLVKYSLIIEDIDGNQLAIKENVSGNNSINKTTYSSNFNNTVSDLVTDNYVLKIVTSSSGNFTVDARARAFSTSTSYVNEFSEDNITSINIDLIVEDNMPKMQVIDFLTGFMKMFKVIIRPTSINTFYFDTIDNYYSQGKIIDITDYVDQEKVIITRPTIYNKLNFKYNKTNNVNGKKFRDLFSPIEEIGYGDVSVSYPQIKSGEELKIEVKFDNMMFENITSFDGDITNIYVGQAISTSDYISFSNNSSTILMFYNNGINTNHFDTPFKLKVGDNTPIDQKYSYLVGNTNNEFFDQVTDTLNFDSEIDPWHGIEIQSSLFSNYWFNWIATIYALKQRKFKYDAVLPARYLKELSLNDRLIIGDKRFKINDFKANARNGDTELNLYVDIYNNPTTITESIVTPSNLITNAGTKYYDVFLTSNQSWNITFIDTGDGNDWVTTEDDLSGENSKLLTFRVNEKASQFPPEVYEERSMIVRITLEDLTELDITIVQTGLIAP